MKHLPLILITLLFLLNSCINPIEEEKKRRAAEKEKKPETEYLAEPVKAESLTDIYKKALFDTVGLYLAPVKVSSAKLVKREYSNYRDISIRYKNTSDKTVSAIRFKWYGLNAFGDPADMGSGIDGFGKGFSDDILRPGKSDYGTWAILSKDAKSIVLAWPTEVVFEDGTKWKAGK